MARRIASEACLMGREHSQEMHRFLWKIRIESHNLVNRWQTHLVSMACSTTRGVLVVESLEGDWQRVVGG